MMFVDFHELEEIIYSLKLSIPDVVTGDLNGNGYADYMWLDYKGNRRQWDRNQLAEILSDLDKCESDLHIELLSCDELTLVVEGPGLATPTGIQSYLLTDDRTFFRKGWHIPGPKAKPQPGMSARYKGWKWGVRYAGIVVVETVHWTETAAELASCYAASMRSEHTTLKRYVTPHIPAFDKNIHVENLARLKECGIGPERAQQLVAEFGTFWGVVSASYTDLADILGPKVAQGFIEKIGRRIE